MHTRRMDKTSNIKTSGKLLPESRIERISDDVGLPEKEILSLLKAAMGGDDTPPWPANQRWLLWHSAELIGHVSVQRRWFVVNRRYWEGWHVGGVCVHPSVQREGIGSYLMSSFSGVMHSHSGLISNKEWLPDTASNRRGFASQGCTWLARNGAIIS